MKLNKNVWCVALLAALVVGPAAEAAAIEFNPSSTTVAEGDTFGVSLVGRDFTEGAGGTYGGGVSISWDPSVLRLVSYDTSVFDGDQLLAGGPGTNTVLDNTAGTLSNLSVASLFDGVSVADFDIALLTFEAIGGGQSMLSSALGYFTSGFPNIWTDSDPFAPTALDVRFGTAKVTAVPVPAAALLLLTGLGGFGLVRRKRA